jgi:hypothetical protein
LRTFNENENAKWNSSPEFKNSSDWIVVPTELVQQKKHQNSVMCMKNPRLKKYIVVNNIKAFFGLPVLSNKSMTIDNKE